MAEEAKKKKPVGLLDLAYLLLLVVLLFYMVFHVGRPRVGVIDVLSVARGVGMGDRIGKDSELWRSRAAGGLQALQSRYGAQSKDLRATLAAATEEEEQARLRRELGETTGKYREEADAIRTEMRNHQRDVLETFRRRLQPFISEVARERRLRVILERRGNVAYALARVDVTADVIEKSRAFFEQQSTLVDVDAPEAPVAE